MAAPKLFGINFQKTLGRAFKAARAFPSVTLTRFTPTTRDPNDILGGTRPTSASYTTTGFVEEYASFFTQYGSDFQVEGSIIQRGDRKVSVTGMQLDAVGIIPEAGDVVTAEGADYTVVDVRRDPGAVLYELQCRGVVSTSPQKTITGLVVTPATVSMTTFGAAQQLTALVQYSDGTSENVSAMAAWTISAPPLGTPAPVTVSNLGMMARVFTCNTGVTVTATYFGRVGTSAVTCPAREMTTAAECVLATGGRGAWTHGFTFDGANVLTQVFGPTPLKDAYGTSVAQQAGIPACPGDLAVAYPGLYSDDIGVVSTASDFALMYFARINTADTLQFSRNAGDGNCSITANSSGSLRFDIGAAVSTATVPGAVMQDWHGGLVVEKRNAAGAGADRSQAFACGPLGEGSGAQSNATGQFAGPSGVQLWYANTLPTRLSMVYVGQGVATAGALYDNGASALHLACVYTGVLPS